MQKTSTHCVGPRHRLPYLCETATLLIFQRSRRVACCNEIISSALIFSPCGTPPGHRRQPPRRSPLKMRDRTPPPIANVPLTLHPFVRVPTQTGRQARHTVHLTHHIPVMSSFCTFFFAFLPRKKQFSNYDKCQPVILCASFYYFHYVCQPTHNYLSHDVSPRSGVNGT